MTTVAGNNFSDFIWNKFEKIQKGSEILNLYSDCVAATNEKALLQYAKEYRNGTECHVLPKATMGGVHWIRLLGFADRTQWIARIQLRPSTLESVQQMKSEVDTMALLRQQSRVLVPEVYHFELHDDNAVGRAFLLIECLPGNAAMDLDGGPDHHHGDIPAHRKEGFFHDVAAIHVELATVRLPKIGTVNLRNDGSIDIGPIPNIGGPFDTAAEFFEAWATTARYPLSEDTIRKRTGNFADDILASINTFPSTVRTFAPRLSTCNSGPFPLIHPDLYQSNILVDNNYKVIGVIDWEGAHSVPWELVEFPLFLSVVPPSMDAPWNYDLYGQPKDPKVRQMWKDRALYASMVEEFERRGSLDNRLSGVLRDSAAQCLAYAIRRYPEGKMGLYDRVLN